MRTPDFRLFGAWRLISEHWTGAMSSKFNTCAQRPLRQPQRL